MNEIPYSHRPFFCPHCGVLDHQREPESIINTEELPSTFLKDDRVIHGLCLTIKCPACKKIYKSNEENTSPILTPSDKKRIKWLKDQIQNLEIEIEELESQKEEYLGELEEYEESVSTETIY